MKNAKFDIIFILKEEFFLSILSTSNSIPSVKLFYHQRRIKRITEFLNQNGYQSYSIHCFPRAQPSKPSPENSDQWVWNKFRKFYHEPVQVPPGIPCHFREQGNFQPSSISSERKRMNPNIIWPVSQTKMCHGT